MNGGILLQRGQGVNRVLRLGQVLLGLCSTNQRTSPSLPFRLTPSVIPDEPSISHSEPRRHLVCQNPCPNYPQKALGPSCRNQFSQGVKHGPKDDSYPDTPQHLRGRMITQSIPWSSANPNNTDGQLSRPGHSPRRSKDPPGISHSTGPCDQTEDHSQAKEEVRELVARGSKAMTKPDVADEKRGKIRHPLAMGRWKSISVT